MPARSPNAGSSRFRTTSRRKLSPFPYRWALPPEADVREDLLRLRLDFHSESVVLLDYAGGVVRTKLVSDLDVAHALARELDLASGVLPWDTLLGGYASTLFHQFYRFSPAIRAEFAHGDEAKWVAHYGYLNRITRRDHDARVDDGRRSKWRAYLTQIIEKPGVTPPILFHSLATPSSSGYATWRNTCPPTRSRCCWSRSTRRPSPTSHPKRRATGGSQPTCARRCSRRCGRAPSACSGPTCRRCSPTLTLPLCAT